MASKNVRKVANRIVRAVANLAENEAFYSAPFEKTNPTVYDRACARVARHFKRVMAPQSGVTDVPRGKTAGEG